MHITLPCPDDTDEMMDIPLDVPGDATPYAVRLAVTKALRGWLKPQMQDGDFCRYYCPDCDSGYYDEGWANTLIDLTLKALPEYLAEHPDGELSFGDYMEFLLADLLEDHGREDPHEAWWSGHDELMALAAEQLDASLEALGIPGDGEGWLREVSQELAWEMDDSSPWEMVPSQLHAEIHYIPGLNSVSSGIDDLTLNSVSGWVNDPMDLYGDENSARLLALAGIDKHAFLAGLLVYRDQNWREMERAEEWASLRVSPDGDGRPRLTVEELIGLIEDAGCTAGVPVMTCRVQVLSFMKQDPRKPLVVEQGCIGIHDFFSGCGARDAMRAPLTVPPGSQSWASNTRYKYGPSSVYGSLERKMHCVLRQETPCLPAKKGCSVVPAAA